MRYMDFEKEYIKDRLIEPYSENEDTSDWANLTRYAEDNLLTRNEYDRNY